VSTWVITAGVRLHGLTRASPAAIKTSPAATMNASRVSPIPLDD
jgi:hypothetical protein